MPAHWQLEAHVDASPERVYAWMSDLAEDDHARPAFRRAAGDRHEHARRVILSREGNRLRVRDEWGRRTFETDVELLADVREVRIRGDFGYRAVWRAEPHGPAGTRLVCEGRLEPKGFARLLAPLFARGFAKWMRRDFEGHVEDLRDAMKEPGSP